MIKRTVPTPIAINAIFLLLLFLPVIFFSIGRASAGSLREQYCSNMYNKMYFQSVPKIVQTRCGAIFERKTKEWMTGNFTSNK